jgi:hypothetical protein
MMTSSPPNFPYQHPGGMIYNIQGAMSQMNLGGPPSAVSPQRDSFGSSGPTQISAVRAFPGPQNFYMIPTSPTGIDSSPNHLVCK